MRHTWSTKKRKPIRAAPSGLPLVQYALQCALERVFDGELTPRARRRGTSRTRLQRCSMCEQRGFLREGYAADLVLVDPNRPTRGDGGEVLSKCGWSPFEGTTFRASIAATFVNGHLAWDAGHAGRQRARHAPGVRPMIDRTGAIACAAFAIAASVAVNAIAAIRDIPAIGSQGALVIGKVAPGSTVRFDDRDLLVSTDGSVVFGVGRDEKGPITVDVRDAAGASRRIAIAVIARDWPIERVDGVPPKTVEPPPAIAARIQREQARVAAERDRNDARDDYEETFIWPVQGRISGRFGNQRVYNGTPKSPHSGMDIAAPAGTPVKAPAAGLVTFADADLYLTGGTVLIDHGHGVSSNFLHLSRIDVKVGDRVEQGEVIGAVGMTGRATGPHLHWGLNWFTVRLDPLLLPGIGDATSPQAR